MTKPTQTKSTQTKATPDPPPTIDAVGMVLNTSTIKTNRHKTSRFHIRGKNFQQNATVTLVDPNSDWDVHELVHDSKLITVRAKFIRAELRFLQTGDVTITVTNGDGQQATITAVTAAYVTEDDLP